MEWGFKFVHLTSGSALVYINLLLKLFLLKFISIKESLNVVAFSVCYLL